MASETYTHPSAPAPDIIRSHQKDAYFQGLLLEHLSTLLRNLYGARLAHTYTTESRTAADLLYLGLTTFLGNRTLGEEYCDIIQVESHSRRLPAVARRAGYILTSVLGPYALNRALPVLRRRVRAKLEAGLRRAERTRQQRGGDRGKKDGGQVSLSEHVQKYALANLDALTSPAPVYALSLAVFYFSGSYYHLGKRLWGLRYIFTRRVEESEQRVGYEVLGVLLVLQMAVQGWLHLHSTAAAITIANSGAVGGTSAVLGNGAEVSLNPNDYSSNNALLFEAENVGGNGKSKEDIQRITHTPVLSGPRYDLEDVEKMAWIDGERQRKCTLCLEEMKDPSVTTCGHVFCWTCIGDWCREKPECPLCRQTSMVQHILPLRC